MRYNESFEDLRDHQTDIGCVLVNLFFQLIKDIFLFHTPLFLLRLLFSTFFLASALGLTVPMTAIMVTGFLKTVFHRYVLSLRERAHSPECKNGRDPVSESRPLWNERVIVYVLHILSWERLFCGYCPEKIFLVPVSVLRQPLPGSTEGAG